MPNPAPEHALGFLNVSVSTAQDAIPVEGATVTVSAVDDSGAAELVYTVTTDRSGMTGRLALPAPPRQTSLTPGQAHPYAVYNVRVDHPRFQPSGSINLTIFDGIVADLPVYLLPLEETETQPGAPNVNVFPPHHLNEQKGG